MKFRMKKDWFKKKKVIIPLSFFMLLVAIRLVMQPIIHKQLNSFLSQFSPELTFHIDDLDIHLIRGAYVFESVTGKIKESKHQFLSIEKVDTSIAWRELFKGKVVTDIEVTGLDFSYSKALKEVLAKTPKKEDAKEAKDKLFPVDVVRLDIQNSSLKLDKFPAFTRIEGRVTNLLADKDNPLSFLNLKATAFGHSVIKLAGQLKTLEKPMAWSMDGELQGFDLTEANQFLKEKVPLTFTKGKLDVYAEAKSEEGIVEGYVKPFMKNVDIMKVEEHLKGAKHWFIEVIAAIGNLILRTSDKKSVATLIPFTMDKSGVHVDKGKALSKALQHGFEQKLSPGIEDRLKIE